MDIISTALAILHDLPGHLALWTSLMGPWIYVLLFGIIFAETGLIVTPFLPGDSLLFAIGALCAIEGGLDLKTIVLLLSLGVIMGDTVNYSVGRWIGPRLFRNHDSNVLNPKHLHRTQHFYEKHGGKTIILARFIPIVRTYAPFVAGLGRMKFARFAAYSVSGGIGWILIFTVAGFFFGNIPQIKSNFHIVIAAIIVISVMPAVIEYYRSRRTELAAKEPRV